MNTFDAILKRRSIRKYDEEKHITDEQIELILKAGMSAPSAKNKQPWEFYCIKNKEIQNKIKSLYPAFNYNSDLLIIVCGNRIDQNQESIIDFWIEDCSACVENMLIEATELNLGSLWCGLYPRMDRVDQIKNIINIDINHMPLALLQFGYSNETKEEKNSYDLNKVHYV